MFERGLVGRGSASWASGGILFPLHPADVSGKNLQLLKASLATYQDWAKELAETSGIDPQYLASGLDIRTQAGEAQAWETLCSSLGYAFQSENGKNTGDRELFLSKVAQVRSPRLLRALKAAVLRLGGAIFQNTAVTGLCASSGKLNGVKTASGRHASELVVLCAGAWSSGLLPELPITPVRGQMLALRSEPGMLSSIVLKQRKYLVPRSDGIILAGSTLEQCGFDDSPTEPGRAELQSAALALDSRCKSLPLVAHWSGLRPMPMTGQTMIEWSRQHENLLINVGQYRLGMTLAPASAADALRQIEAL